MAWDEAAVGSTETDMEDVREPILRNARPIESTRAQARRAIVISLAIVVLVCVALSLGSAPRRAAERVARAAGEFTLQNKEATKHQPTLSSGGESRPKKCFVATGARMNGTGLLHKLHVATDNTTIGAATCRRRCLARATCFQSTYVGWAKQCLLYRHWNEEPIEFRDGMYETSYCGTDVHRINATLQRVYKKKPYLPVWYDCAWPTDYKRTNKATVYSASGFPKMYHTAPQLCSLISDDCSWYEADCSKMKCCAKRDFDQNFNWVGQQCVKKDDDWAVCMAPSAAAKVKAKGWNGSILGGFRTARKLPPASPGILVQPDTLFCFSVVMWHMPSTKGDSEAALASNWRDAYKGIMQCDGHKIYEGVPAKMESWGSFSNIDAFLLVWDKVNKDKLFLKYGWTVKVDADAVFFPFRLKQHLARLRTPQGARVFLKNTDFKFQFLGALEIMTREALQLFMAHRPECNGGGAHSGGEDWFLVSCLEAMGVDCQEDFKLLHDQYAAAQQGDPSCGDGSYVAFHPYKTVVGWNNCWNQAGR